MRVHQASNVDRGIFVLLPLNAKQLSPKLTEFMKNQLHLINRCTYKFIWIIFFDSLNFFFDVLNDKGLIY